MKSWASMSLYPPVHPSPPHSCKSPEIPLEPHSQFTTPWPPANGVINVLVIKSWASPRQFSIVTEDNYVPGLNIPNNNDDYKINYKERPVSNKWVDVTLGAGAQSVNSFRNRIQGRNILNILIKRNIISKFEYFLKSLVH